MGTTCSCLVLTQGAAIVGHVGDSRVYRLRHRVLEQLTFDHSLVWEMAAASKVSADRVPSCIPKDKNLVMHMSMIIMGGHELMGSDAPESMGFKVSQGNNVYIMLQPDTRSETDKLFKGLSQGATIEQELQDMFWGDYYGSLKDKFGVQWMFACPEKK
jgi:PhnB protein